MAASAGGRSALLAVMVAFPTVWGIRDTLDVHSVPEVFGVEVKHIYQINVGEKEKLLPGIAMLQLPNRGAVRVIGFYETGFIPYHNDLWLHSGRSDVSELVVELDDLITGVNHINGNAENIFRTIFFSKTAQTLTFTVERLQPAAVQGTLEGFESITVEVQNIGGEHDSPGITMLQLFQQKAVRVVGFEESGFIPHHNEESPEAVVKLDDLIVAVNDVSGDAQEIHDAIFFAEVNQMLRITLKRVITQSGVGHYTQDPRSGKL